MHSSELKTIYHSAYSSTRQIILMRFLCTLKILQNNFTEYILMEILVSRIKDINNNNNIIFRGMYVYFQFLRVSYIIL